MEHALLSLGMPQLTGNHPAYINLTRRFFIEEVIPFHKDEVVLELLEHIEPDKELLQSLKRLAARGYRLALDDYILDQDERHWLVPHVNVIKVDVLNMSYQDVVRHVRWLKRHRGPDLLAEKVETHQMFELCRKAGFNFFQGFFLSRPLTLRGQSLSTDRGAILELLAELYKPELDIGRVEHLIIHDLSLSYTNCSESIVRPEHIGTRADGRTTESKLVAFAGARAPSGPCASSARRSELRGGRSRA
ncbi:hypothetical protein CCR81_06220 [Halorhodospira halophila]|nr:hypothetical protein [Halorhodospira halophila]